MQLIVMMNYFIDYRASMTRTRSSLVSAPQLQGGPQSSLPSSPPTPPVRKSSRKREAEDVAVGAELLTPPVLRRSKRNRTALHQQSSIFETPPSTIKKQKQKQKLSKSKVTNNKSKPAVTKPSGPPPTLMSLPYSVQLKLLSYLDVSSLESLAATSSQFDLLIHGRYLTTINIPFDESFLQELAATDSIEKKPLLRLQCTKLRGKGGEDGGEDFMSTFVESRHGLREYIIHSQMALLQLDKVREIDLVPRSLSQQHMKNHMMWDSFQAFDKIILRQMSRLDILGNLSRLEIMIVDEDFSQTVLKEFMPKLKTLLEFRVTITETRSR